MSEQYDSLADGQYPCSATLHIKDGKALVTLDSTFGLKPGTTILLYRKEGDLVVDQLAGEQIPNFFNGLTII